MWARSVVHRPCQGFLPPNPTSSRLSLREFFFVLYVVWSDFDRSMNPSPHTPVFRLAVPLDFFLHPAPSFFFPSSTGRLVLLQEETRLPNHPGRFNPCECRVSFFFWVLVLPFGDLRAKAPFFWGGEPRRRPTPPSAEKLPCIFPGSIFFCFVSIVRYPGP